MNAAQLPIVIPSMGRASNVSTVSLVDDPIVCVPESEAAQYREHNPGVEVEAHPDTVVGLPAKREWMYQRWGDLFMVDDDAVALFDVSAATIQKVGSGDARALIERVYADACGAGAFLFGLSRTPDPRTYFPNRPFRRTGLVLGGAYGLRAGSGLWWNKRMMVGEDFWISCLNAHYHRTLWVDTRYAFMFSKTFASTGGLSLYRTEGSESEATEILKENFGNVINKKLPTRLVKTMRNNQRALKIPF